MCYYESRGVLVDSPTETKPIKWLTVRQYMEVMPLSKPHVYRMLSEGKIPHTRIGRRVLIHPKAIEEIAEVEE